MHVVISNRIVRKPIGWTAGYCPACQRLQPCRAEELLQVTSVSGIPFARAFCGYAASCDFCSIDPEWTIANSVKLPDWSPQQGLSELTTRLDPNFPPVENTPVDESCLTAMLDGLKRATQFNQFDISAGLVLGGILGLLLGIALGFGLYEGGLRIGRMDKTGIVMMTTLISLGVGAVLGAVWHVLRGRARLALARINHACDYSGAEIEKIAILANSYPSRIQSAVRQVRDQRQYGRKT